MQHTDSVVFFEPRLLHRPDEPADSGYSVLLDSDGEPIRRPTLDSCLADAVAAIYQDATDDAALTADLSALVIAQIHAVYHRPASEDLAFYVDDLNRDNEAPVRPGTVGQPTEG